MTRLAFFSEAAGDPHARLARLAATLAADMRLAGALQESVGPADDCDVDLRVLGDPRPPLRISQSLGRGSTACRLDAGALEEAAARVAARLDGAELLILSKFGKQEAAGRGFRQVIGLALESDLPVILHVPPEYRADFDAFAGPLAQELTPEALEPWCRAAARAPAA